MSPATTWMSRQWLARDPDRFYGPVMLGLASLSIIHFLAFSFLCRYQRWLCQNYQVILTLYGLLRETLKVSFN